MMARTTRLILVLLPLLVGATLLRAQPAPEPAAPAIKLEPVKYNELADLIRGLKGKVVVVDFWADFCLPCKREFPHLVELYQKYGKDGLVAVSVSLDDPAKKDAHERALKFLQKMGATFTNLRLDEPPAVWQAKLKINGPPCVYVLNRDNRIVKKLPVGDEGVDYAEVEKVVKEWLKK
jgi:thiol-disulfide isomerase/thioredoxin